MPGTPPERPPRPVEPRPIGKEGNELRILETRALALPGAHLLRFHRYRDERGYFTETFRRSDFDGVEFLRGVEFRQCNESHSRAGVIRGLHFQWEPPMGKLVRTVHGRMIDLALDIRRGSPTFGRAIAVDLPADPEAESADWIWLPPGFAHGNAFTEPTTIEYFCTAEWNPDCEAGISPLAEDLDWSLSDPAAKAVLDRVRSGGARMSDKDRDGLTLAAWTADPRSRHFALASGGSPETDPGGPG